MYCITRSEKIKDYQQITSMIEHNFRLRAQENIDDSKTHLNKILFNSLNADMKQSSSFGLCLKNFYNSLEKENPINANSKNVPIARSDSVLCVETIISASPEFFENKSDEEIDEWAATQVEFMKNKFGENLKLAVFHKDELTPHLHFVFTPEEKKEKVYTNRYGTKKIEAWSLNNKRFNPRFFTDMHTDLAFANKSYNLMRGEKNSKKVHKPMKQYYIELENQRKKLLEKLTELDKKIEETDEKIKEVTELEKYKKAFPYLKQTILNSFESIKELLSILDKKQLSKDEMQKIEEIAKKVPQENLQTNQNKIKTKL